MTDQPYVDPEMAIILQEIAAEPPMDRPSLSIAEAREQMEAGNIAWNKPLPEMAEARDFSITGPEGDIPCRLLRPP